MNTALVRSFVIGFVMLAIGLGVGYYIGYDVGVAQAPLVENPYMTPSPTSSMPPTDEEMVYCTLDAKLCPDGSSVGRVPPTCEFAPCPGEENLTPSF